jgi:hypothetical protein
MISHTVGIAFFIVQGLFALHESDFENQFTTLNQQNAQLFLRYVYYNITLSIPTYFDPQGTNIREPN